MQTYCEDRNLVLHKSSCLRYKRERTERKLNEGRTNERNKDLKRKETKNRWKEGNKEREKLCNQML
jgi:hypothetical protein